MAPTSNAVMGIDDDQRFALMKIDVIVEIITYVETPFNFVCVRNYDEGDNDDNNGKLRHKKHHLNYIRD
ncbi:unnamed protein product [Colias eurytheme]|nr:unnamed protein product [Colias eurytheme]